MRYITEGEIGGRLKWRERGGVGLGEVGSCVWSLKKESERKRLLHWPRSLFSAALYSDLLSIESQQATLTL